MDKLPAIVLMRLMSTGKEYLGSQIGLCVSKNFSNCKKYPPPLGAS